MKWLRRCNGAALLVVFTTLACSKAQSQVPSKPHAAPDSGAQAPGGPAEERPDFEAAFAQLRARLPQQRQSLTRVQASGLDGSCASARAYSRKSVADTYARVQKDVLQQVSDPAAAPLAGLLQERFPKLPAAKTTPCFGSIPVYEDSDVTSLWQSITEFLGFASSAAKPMKVTIITEPSDAIAQLRPAAGGNAPAAQWTECTFDRLYRGVYRLSVEKEGYKSFGEQLGVLEDDAVTIRCVLAATGSGASSRCAVKQ